jgi:hypothetical protein
MRPTSLLTALAIGASCALTGACADGGETLLILQNQRPGDEECIVPAARTAEFVQRGIIDTRGSIGYLFTPVVQSFAEVGPSSSRQQRIVVVEGANVDLTLQDGALPEGADINPVLTSFSQPFSGTIEPGGTASFIFTIVPIELIKAIEPQLDGGRISAQVRADVSIFGKMGGGSVRSETFVYWVDVCDGCLVSSVGSCAALPADYEPVATGNACNPTQDTVQVDCCESGGALVCPAKPSL